MAFFSSIKRFSYYKVRLRPKCKRFGASFYVSFKWLLCVQLHFQGSVFLVILILCFHGFFISGLYSKCTVCFCVSFCPCVKWSLYVRLRVCVQGCRGSASPSKVLQLLIADPYHLQFLVAQSSVTIANPPVAARRLVPLLLVLRSSSVARR